MAPTGQIPSISSELQSLHSCDITFDFPFSILKTLGQTDSQVPHPIHNSSFTLIFDIFFKNHQDTRNNNQTIFNNQSSNAKLFWLLIIDICNLFVSCYLVIDYFD